MSCFTVNHLSEEHSEIRQILDAFERFLSLSTQETGPDRHELWTLIDVLTESLFMRHEEKEETCLLPELARQGLSWTDGTLSHVRNEHRHGRYLIRSLRDAIHQLKEWNSADRAHFLSVGREWSEFVRGHMDREEKLLFPYLDRQLSPEQDAALVAQFEGIDADFEAMPDWQQLASGRDAFLQRYGVDQADVA